MVPLKCLNNLWITVCEIIRMLTWSVNYVIVSTADGNQGAAFWITDATSCFKRTINWSKDQSKVTTQVQNPYLDYFSRSKRLFVLSFEDNDYWTSCKRYFFQL